jgi:hypothetical protein
MPFKKNNPGCKCCTCSADGNHVCICNCLLPVPKQLFYGDDNGTHTLSWNASSFIWTGTATQAGVDVYNATFCTHSTIALNYFLTLAYHCVPGTGLPSAGAWPTGHWRFNIAFFSVFNCTPPTYQYTNNQSGVTTQVNAGQLIEGFHCDVADGLSFTLPTVDSTTGLAIPGGGGLITVLP